MDLKVQKRLSAQILDCSPKRVIFDNDRLDDIKQAITNRDLRLLIGDGAISKKPMNATSKFRVRKLKVQKSKGRRKGPGSRKGKYNTHFKGKLVWMNNVITRKAFRELYLKSKGGYFRSRRHIKLYLQEHDEMLAKNAVPEKKAPVKIRQYKDRQDAK
jgi:large subunit ribosomal protein L19e